MTEAKRKYKAGEESGARVRNTSKDREYFTLTPRIVWALCETPHQYTLWAVVKDIAGEDGECFLARDELAALAMMAPATVSEARGFLMDKGLLVGELRRDPGYPQPVWHLRVPDLWAANVAWATSHSGLLQRVAFKIDQKAGKEPSPGDGSQEEPSPGDGGLRPGDGEVMPGDGGLRPGDVKKNQKEDPKEERKEDGLKSRLIEAFGEVYRDGSRGSPATHWLHVIRPALDAAVFSVEGEDLLIIRELPIDLLPWLEDRCTRSFERAAVGALGREVAIAFEASATIPSAYIR